MYVGTVAAEHPDRPAVIMAESGTTLTYRELDERSARIAAWLLAQGIRRGDRIALFMENRPEFLEVSWAAFRAGLEIATPSRYLSADEVAYIVNDCGAKALFTSASQLDTARQIPGKAPGCQQYVLLDGAEACWVNYDEVVSYPRMISRDDEWMGHVLHYTSGTTGRPRGVIRPFPEMRAWDVWPKVRQLTGLFELTGDAVYLSTAPLYHGAPSLFVRAMQCLGATIVVMERFDPIHALECIEKYRVTHSQWVPTMFSRMLKAVANDTRVFDLSTHRVAIHAAAPCPVEIKRQMIDWWGPILYEYYGATDGANMLTINSEQWLQHPGSVGLAPANGVKICAEDGTVLSEGEEGTIYLVAINELPEYLNDPEKTRKSRHPQHPNWMTVGDIGYIKDGYLYLSDRRDNLIISGGVNIYPQAIEDALISHPEVFDAAVFGIPNADMGEEVKAVVQLIRREAAGPEMEQELMRYCATKLGKIYAPRSVDFVESLPRTPTGKLLKRVLRDEYRARLRTA